MSSNLYKANWVVFDQDARVINSNDLMKQKMKVAAMPKAVQREPLAGEEEGDFASGLDAEKVEALLDPDSKGALLKSTSREELEALEKEIESARGELDQVRAEAVRLMEESKAQIEQMRVSALEEAKARGYQAGFDEGMAQMQSAKEQYINKQAELEEEYNRQVELLEPEFIETLTEIYEHIFKVDLSAYHQLVVTLLIDAMQKTDSAKNYIVHVAKQDYPAVSDARERILEETGTLAANLEIVSDMTLSVSQCMIETEDGIYDCSLGTELEELKRKLKLISFKK